MFPTNGECLISISDAFSAFVYGYPSSCPHAHCTPNKSVPTLRYARRPGPVYTGHACRHLPSAVPWISEDRLLPKPEPKGHTEIFRRSFKHFNQNAFFADLICTPFDNVVRIVRVVLLGTLCRYIGLSQNVNGYS